MAPHNMQGLPCQCNAHVAGVGLARFVMMVHDHRMVRSAPRIFFLALLLPACATKLPSPPATRSADQFNVQNPEAAAKLAGRYFLRGVMETASGLELADDGSFQWYLVVGALDVIGTGRWELMNDRVRLNYEDIKSNGEIPELTETILLRSGENLIPADGSRGIYVRAKPTAAQ